MGVHMWACPPVRPPSSLCTSPQRRTAASSRQATRRLTGGAPPHRLKASARSGTGPPVSARQQCRHQRIFVQQLAWLLLLHGHVTC